MKILNLTAIVCHLGGLFSVVFPKNKTINYSHVTNFIGFYWFYNIKVVEIGYAVNSAQIILNLARVITVLLILCKLGLSHALTCLSRTLTSSLPKKSKKIEDFLF